jgi:hypothetical protein
MKKLHIIFSLLLLLLLVAMAPPRENVPEGHFSQPPLGEPWEIDPLEEEGLIWQYENSTGCDLRIVQWITVVPTDGRPEPTYGITIPLNAAGQGTLDLRDIRNQGFSGGGIINRASMAVYVNGSSQPIDVLAGESRRFKTPFPWPCDCIHIIADYRARIIRFLPC